MIGLVLDVMACRGEGIQDQGGYLRNGPKMMFSVRGFTKQQGKVTKRYLEFIRI